MSKVNTPPKVLTEWIDIATCGLIAPAKERIRQEVEAHFADAFEARTAEGLSVEDSEIAAVRELGDAKVAARKFAANHLTELDAKVLLASRERHDTSPGGELLRWGLFVLCWFLLCYLNGNAGWVMLILIASVSGAWMFVERWISELFFRNQLNEPDWTLAESKRFLLYDWVVCTATLIAISIGFWVTCRSAFSAGWIGLAVAEIGEIRVFWLWRKLLRVEGAPLGNA